MNRLLAVLIALICFSILCFACIQLNAPLIESDLLTRSEQALAATQIPAKAVRMDGRDATLRGTAGSDAVSDRARSTVEAVYGVRVVNTEIVPAEAAPVPVTPAPAVAAAPSHQEAQAKLDELLSGAVVEFNSASARLTPRGSEVLDRVATILATVPDALCEISGYTDAVGPESDNQYLSTRRAQVTKEYLVAKGIAAERLLPTGYGSSKPVASNDTDEGRQKNRRIEFHLKGRN